MLLGYSFNNFEWDSYLSVTGSIKAPDDIFVGREQASIGADSSVQGWKIGELICKIKEASNQNLFS